MLCPCGSGKKYKFCCYGVEDKKFHNPNEVYMYVVNQGNKKSFCMHEDEMCHSEMWSYLRILNWWIINIKINKIFFMLIEHFQNTITIE